MSYLGQDLLIDNLNQEFKKLRFPTQVHFNEGGVCNGLAMVYAQYALQGPEKEAEFFKILKLIADGKLTEEENYGLQEGSILLFASQVLLSFQPSKYDLSQTQSTSMEMLKINGKPLSSSFDFALAAADKEWSQVIAKIELQHDEVMIVHSVNHAVSVRKLNDKYRIYDPNYSSGFKEFVSEAAMIKELHKNVFGYGRGNLGMEVHVVRNPDATPRQVPFPEIQALYEHHLSPQKSTAKLGSKTFNTFDYASTIIKDPLVIKMLIAQIQPSKEELFTTAKRVVLKNNSAALEPLLEIIHAETEPSKKLRVLLEIAIGTGRLGTYSQLEKYFPQCYSSEHLGHLVALAAKGGNPQILERVLNEVQPSQRAYVDKFVTENMNNGKLTIPGGVSMDFAKDAYLQIFMNKNMVDGIHVALGYAVEKGNTECIKILIGQLNSYKEPLNEKQLLNYFLKAIEHNQPYALEKLINAHPDMSKEVLSLLSMSPLSVKRTDLDVLRILKQNGVPFSEQAENIIQSKEKDQYRSFSTMVNLLINYIQNLFGKKQLGYDEQQLLAMKKDACKEVINKIEEELVDLKETDKAQYEIYAKAIEVEAKKLEGEQNFANVVRIANKLQNLFDKITFPVPIFDFKDFNFNDSDSEDEEDSLEDISELFEESSEEEQYGIEDIADLFEEPGEDKVIHAEVNVQSGAELVEEQSSVTSKFKEQLGVMREDTHIDENQVDIHIAP
ncbi:hypothetical protein ACD661_01430 [Legionella lytica]|uniref:Ankyrin repeat-containing protein n=1 Tax=Legionella lytica TaxID=96232 RepID=A0ABW8D5H7_9GAMM